MSKREEFNAKLKEAMKSKDEVAVSTLRLVLSALKDKDINARGSGNADGIAEGEILAMLQSMVKQRRESLDIYQKAGRADLAGREEQEIKIIESFLPAQMSEDDVKAEIGKIITETGAKDIKDMGKVMGVLKTRYAGQVDMAKAGGWVKEKLG